MKKHFLALLLAAGLATTAHATNYPGNGNTGFTGPVGGGTLSVTNNAAGAFVFSFSLGGNQTSFNSSNDLVFYIDTGKGGGIGNTTANLTDFADGGRQAVSQYSGTQRSTLTFASLLNPQFALDISTTNANVYNLVNNRSLGFAGGGANSANGVTFSEAVAGTKTVVTETVPANVLGLTANAGATFHFVAILVSETGYSSDEATVGINGSFGYGNTQTIDGINSYTAAVPEPGTWGVPLLGGLVLVQRRRLFMG